MGGINFPDNPEENSGKGGSFPFGSNEARKQRDTMNGDTNALEMGKGPSLVGANRTVNGLPVVNISGKLPTGK